MTVEDLRQFVAASCWHFAKSMAAIPHEYTLRREATDRSLFERVVLHIRGHGYEADFNGRTFAYFDLDGWQYWTMGDQLTKTILINRARLKETK